MQWPDEVPGIFLCGKTVSVNSRNIKIAPSTRDLLRGVCMVSFASEVGHKMELCSVYDRAALTDGGRVHETEVFCLFNYASLT
jgi:hypothetical protein